MAWYWWVIIGVVYFIPFIHALIRWKPNTVSVFLLNLFLGWTVLGWIEALNWSGQSPEEIYMSRAMGIAIAEEANMLDHGTPNRRGYRGGI